MNHFLQPKKLRRTGLTLVLLCGGFLFAQALLRWSADYYLRERARIPVRIGRLFINPATSRVTLGLKGAEPGQVLLVDLGQVRFDWWTVLLRRLRLGSVALQGIDLDIEKRADGSLLVGGINIPKGEPAAAPATATASPKSAGKPWGVGIGGIHLDNIALHYKDPLIDVDVHIRHFQMTSAESWHPNLASPFEGEFLINGATLTLHGEAYPFRENPTVVAQINLQGLPLGWLAPLAHQSGISTLSGTLSASSEIHLDYETKSGGLMARWNGPLLFNEVAVGGPAVGLSEVRFTGTLTLEDVSVLISSAAPAVIRAKAIALPAPNRLFLSDRTLKPAFRWTLSPLDLRIENIDTSSEATLSRVKLSARPGRHEKIDVAGEWALMSKVPNGEIDLKVDGLNLTPFSPFVEKSIGWRIRSGLYDHKTHAKLDHGLLQSDNSFVAHTFYLDKLGQEDLQGDTAQLGLPLGLALTLLRDADDNIRLAVPVEGDLSNPQVNKWSLVWTILGKAVRAAVRAAVTAFFPSGTHIGFDPIAYAPGQAVLMPDAAAYITKAAGNLAQHPQVSLKVTGYAVADDAYALMKKKKKEGQPPLDLNTLPSEIKDKLLTLATQRAEAVQTHFSEAGLDPKRIVFTPPILDPKPDALPRAELSL